MTFQILAVFFVVLEVSRDSSRPLGDRGRPDWETSSDIFYSKSETGNRDGKKFYKLKPVLFSMFRLWQSIHCVINKINFISFYLSVLTETISHFFFNQEKTIITFARKERTLKVTKWLSFFGTFKILYFQKRNEKKIWIGFAFSILILLPFFSVRGVCIKALRKTSRREGESFFVLEHS